MTSANGNAGGDSDERLAQALNATLFDGEQVIAQETGDQGQAIVLTKSRIIIVKAGFAATGEVGGHKVSPFALEAVSSINLRKGPLGAVIQVCTENGNSVPQSSAPDNVVVFTGPGRVKKAEAFASIVEAASGKPITKAGRSGHPHSSAEQVVIPDEIASPPAEAAAAPVEEVEQQKPRKEPRSLADELYSQMMAAGQTEEEPELSTRVEVDPEPVAQTSAERSAGAVVESFEPTPVEEAVDEGPVAHRPNPKLPRPVRRHKRSPVGVLALLGACAVLVLVGMAIMGPIRDAQKTQSLEASAAQKSADAKSVLLRFNAVVAYSKQISGIVAQATAEGAACRSAVGSGNRAALRSIGADGKTDKSYTTIKAIPAPPGLAEAKENILSGLLAQRNAITSASSAAQTSAPVTAGGTLPRLNQGAAQIKKGLNEIAWARYSLEKQLKKSRV